MSTTDDRVAAAVADVAATFTFPALADLDPGSRESLEKIAAAGGISLDAAYDDAVKQLGPNSDAAQAAKTADAVRSGSHSTVLQ